MPQNRVYLDWNATAPLRPEARAAMLSAMEAVGNPSSVHAEGRAAKAIVDRARGRVAALVGCDRDAVVFTSGATEAAALAVAQKPRHGGVFLATATEHDCLFEWSDAADGLPVGTDGRPAGSWAQAISNDADGDALIAISAANSETGVLTGAVDATEGAAEDRSVFADFASDAGPDGAPRRRSVVVDITQAAGRATLARRSTGVSGPSYRILSAHKLGGPKGVGALIDDGRGQLIATIRGGGHERGARSGTENVIGAAGFGAAAEAAMRDFEAGAWAPVAALRDQLEARLKTAAPEAIVFGEGAPRLPNTSCVAIPGWRGETQVIQMDLAGFAISAGSACSSGKVKASRVLMAMGADEETAGSAIRVSMGLATTDAEVAAFAEAWERAYRRWRDRRGG